MLIGQGRYQLSFLPAPSAALGTYRIEIDANYSGDSISDTESFKLVNALVNETGVGGLPLSIFNSIRDSYTRGETVNLFSTVVNSSGGLVNATVNYEIFNPNNDPYGSGSSLLIGQGRYQLSFSLTPSAVLGIYRIEIDANYSGDSISDTKSFTVSDSSTVPRIQVEAPAVIDINTDFGITVFTADENGLADNCDSGAKLRIRDTLSGTNVLTNAVMTNFGTGLYNYTYSVSNQSNYLAIVNCTMGANIYTGIKGFSTQNVPATENEAFAISSLTAGSPRYPGETAMIEATFIVQNGSYVTPDNISLVIWYPDYLSTWANVTKSSFSQIDNHVWRYTKPIPTPPTTGMYIVHMQAKYNNIVTSRTTQFRIATGGPYSVSLDCPSSSTIGSNLDCTLTILDEGESETESICDIWVDTDGNSVEDGTEPQTQKSQETLPQQTKIISVSISVPSSHPTGSHVVRTSCEYVNSAQPDSTASDSVTFTSGTAPPASPSGGGGGGGGTGAAICTPNVECSELSACINGYESITCIDKNNCISSYIQKRACMLEVPSKITGKVIEEKLIEKEAEPEVRVSEVKKEGINILYYWPIIFSTIVILAGVILTSKKKKGQPMQAKVRKQVQMANPSIFNIRNFIIVILSAIVGASYFLNITIKGLVVQISNILRALLDVLSNLTLPSVGLDLWAVLTIVISILLAGILVVLILILNRLTHPVVRRISKKGLIIAGVISLLSLPSLMLFSNPIITGNAINTIGAGEISWVVVLTLAIGTLMSLVFTGGNLTQIMPKSTMFERIPTKFIAGRKDKVKSIAQDVQNLQAAGFRVEPAARKLPERMQTTRYSYRETGTSKIIPEIHRSLRNREIDAGSSPKLREMILQKTNEVSNLIWQIITKSEKKSIKPTVERKDKVKSIAQDIENLQAAGFRVIPSSREVPERIQNIRPNYGRRVTSKVESKVNTLQRAREIDAESASGLRRIISQKTNEVSNLIWQIITKSEKKSVKSVLEKKNETKSIEQDIKNLQAAGFRVVPAARETSEIPRRMQTTIPSADETIFNMYRKIEGIGMNKEDSSVLRKTILQKANEIRKQIKPELQIERTTSTPSRQRIVNQLKDIYQDSEKRMKEVSGNIINVKKTQPQNIKNSPAENQTANMDKNIKKPKKSAPQPKTKGLKKKKILEQLKEVYRDE